MSENIIEKGLRQKKEADDKRLLKEQEKLASDISLKEAADSNRLANETLANEKKAKTDALKAANVQGKGVGGVYSPDQLNQASEFLSKQSIDREVAQSPITQAPVTQTEKPLPASEVAPQNKAPQPQGFSSASGDYGAGLKTQALGLQAKGEQEILDIEKEDALAKNSLLDNFLTEKQNVEAQRKKEVDQAQSELKNLEQEYADTTLTDPDLWGNASTGGKIALALGAIFSSLTPASGAAFRSGIQSNIDRDIDLQKSNLAKKRTTIDGKKSLYAQNLERYKDEDLAGIATREIYLNKIQNDIQSKMATAKSPLVLSKLKLGLGTIQEEKQKNTEAFIIKVSTVKGKSAKAKELNSSDKVRADNLKLLDRSMVDIEDALMKGVNTFSLMGDNEFTLAAKYAAEAFGRMQSGGAINDEESAKFLSLLPTYKDSDKVKKLKIEQAKKLVKERAETLGISTPRMEDEKKLGASEGNYFEE